MVQLKNFLVSAQTSILDVMACIDRNAKGIALVVDGEQRLMGTITDGDIRRAILAGLNMQLPTQVLLDRRTASAYAHPTTAFVGTPEAELLHLMNSRRLRQIPIVDADGRVVDLALL